MIAEGAASVFLTRDQVRRLDRIAVVKYRIPSMILMENAGRGAAEVINRECRVNRSASVVCGVGNNGGDGLVIARHLHNFGWQARVFIVGNREKLANDGALNLAIIEAMRIPLVFSDNWMELHGWLHAGPPAEVIVDAMLGTGFSGPVRPPLDGMIRALTMTPGRTVVAIDVPSGLDADTGWRSNAVVKADMTITFVAPKVGFLSGEASLFIGRVIVVDIGAPPELIAEVCGGSSADELQSP